VRLKLAALCLLLPLCALAQSPSAEAPAVRRVVGGADTISKDTLRRIDGRDLTAGGIGAEVARSYAPSVPKMSADQEREASRSLVLRDWYSTRLYGGGIALGDATRQQLTDSASCRFAQARGHMRSAKVEQAIAERLPNDRQKVRDALTPEQIHEIARGIK